MKWQLISLICDKTAQGLAEYSLIITLLVLGLIIALQGMGVEIFELFEHIGSKASEAL